MATWKSTAPYEVHVPLQEILDLPLLLQVEQSTFNGARRAPALGWNLLIQEALNMDAIADKCLKIAS